MPASTSASQYFFPFDVVFVLCFFLICSSLILLCLRDYVIFSFYLQLSVFYIIHNICNVKSLLDRATNFYIISIGIAVSAKICLIGLKAAG